MLLNANVLNVNDIGQSQDRYKCQKLYHDRKTRDVRGEHVGLLLGRL